MSNRFILVGIRESEHRKESGNHEGKGRHGEEDDESRDPKNNFKGD